MSDHLRTIKIEAKIRDNLGSRIAKRSRESSWNEFMLPIAKAGKFAKAVQSRKFDRKCVLKANGQWCSVMTVKEPLPDPHFGPMIPLGRAKVEPRIRERAFVAQRQFPKMPHREPETKTVELDSLQMPQLEFVPFAQPLQFIPFLPFDTPLFGTTPPNSQTGEFSF
jgi:hypothetical protein